MAHSETKENKSKEISSIEITPAEEGFVYVVHTKSAEGGMCGERLIYAYPDVETVLAKITDDLKSPHARENQPMVEGKKYDRNKFAKLALKGRKS